MIPVNDEGNWLGIRSSYGERGLAFEIGCGDAIIRKNVLESYKVYDDGKIKKY